MRVRKQVDGAVALDLQMVHPVYSHGGSQRLLLLLPCVLHVSRVPGVAAWRSWLNKYGCNMPLLPKTLDDLPPLMSRRESLDRFNQHTAHCPDCQKVRKRMPPASSVHNACDSGAAVLPLLGVVEWWFMVVCNVQIAGSPSGCMVADCGDAEQWCSQPCCSDQTHKR